MTPDARRGRVVSAVLLALVLAAATLARVAQVEELKDQGWAVTYEELAARVLEGRDVGPAIGDVSPAYLWLIAGARAAGVRTETIRWVQIAAVTLASLFCGLAARRLAGRGAGLVAGLLVLANTSVLIVATELNSRTLFLLVLSAALYVLAAGTPGRLAGGLLGLAGAIEPAGLAILAVVLVWHRRSIRRMLPASLLPLVAIAVLNLAVAGRPALLRSGFRFYEGNNPLASACGGSPPRIVADAQALTRHPTPGPLYRALAREAGGSDGYWTGLAAGFIGAHPGEALARFGWKALLTVHHYDVHDVLPSARKHQELSRFPAIPFGVAFVLSVAALLLRERRPLVPFALAAAVLVLTMVLFVVNARERSALLAPLAVLAGTGAARLLELARRRDERVLVAFGGVVIASAMLGIEGRPMREHQYKWWSAFGLEQRLLDPDAPERLFDAALGMQARGEWQRSDAVLASISAYRPLRENRAVSSVAYHRARAALHLGLPRQHVRELLVAAGGEAPGDPDVLALRAVAGDRAAALELGRLHDPFTRELALALALADHGELVRAEAVLDRLVARLPDWRRAVRARHALRTVLARSGSSGAGR